MSRKRRISADDSALFRAHIGDVRRVSHDRVEPSPARPAPIPRKRQEDEAQVCIDMLSDYFHPAELETGEELLFARAGMQNRSLRKLRRGHYRVQAELDLHGMTVPIARDALSAFLNRCRRLDHRCVRIVHGKGNGSRHRGPVLKTMVDRWLRQRDEVLAFCSALPVDGGTGAIYVLLKKL